MQEDQHMQLIRRSSASAEELAERRRTAQRNSTTRASASRHQQTTADTGRGVTPRSALRWRPVSREYDIPLVDGSVLHVTEQELWALPQEYQDAAQLVTPTLEIAPTRQRRTPHPKLPTKADQVIYAGPAGVVPPRTDDFPQPRRTGIHFHWLFFVGLAMIIMLIGWILLTTVANWWATQQDDWQYGRPRTTQYDVNVGHGSSQHPESHFIAENLHRQIIIIEIPGDDPTKAKIYIGPFLIGPGQDLTPVTLSFKDTSGDGKLDLIINVQDSHFVFLNKKVNDVWQFVSSPHQQQ